MIGDEVCDDNIKNDHLGCNPDCSGVLPPFICEGGDTTTASICYPKCNDGLVYFPERCDDGPQPLNLKGCNDFCSAALPGWTCSGGSHTTRSICSPICGDGLVVGNEACDDGIKNDNAGCL